MAETADSFARTRLLLGGEAMKRLQAARVAVFGLGGVGGFACEALARSGVGSLVLVDSDTVSVTNLNRQILATRRTLGRYKADVARERIGDINPSAEVQVYRTFFLPENADTFPFSQWDYVLDAVDTVTAKLALVLKARECGVPIISAMGAGNKRDATRLRVSDISETRVCPLARIMRKELKKRGVTSLRVVWSDEPPVRPAGVVHPPAAEDVSAFGRKRDIPGSTAFVPAVAGLLMAGEVVRDLTEREPLIS